MGINPFLISSKSLSREDKNDIEDVRRKTT